MTKPATTRFRKLALGLFSFSLALIGLLSFNQVAKAAGDYDINRNPNYIGYIQVDSDKQALPLYNSPTDQISNGQLTTTYDRWEITGAYMDSDGALLATAYDLGDNQWVKRSDFTASTLVLKVIGAPFTTFFSNRAAYQLYSDAQTTQPAGILGTDYDIWQINGYAYNKAGQISAYNLGANAWVKYIDPTQTIHFRNDPIYLDIDAGVTTYDVNSNPTGTIQTSTVYVSGVYHFDKNNQIMHNVGTAQQWVYGGDTRQSSYGY